jgi:hypothetical protein
MSTDISDDGGGWTLGEGFEVELSREEATRVAGAAAGEGGAAAAAEARMMVRAGPLLGVEEGGTIAAAAAAVVETCAPAVVVSTRTRTIAADGAAGRGGFKSSTLS